MSEARVGERAKLHIVVFNDGPSSSQLVDVRRLDLRAAIEAAIRITEIVDEEEDHIRPRRGGGEGGGKGKKEEERFHSWNRLNEDKPAIIHAPA